MFNLLKEKAKNLYKKSVDFLVNNSGKIAVISAITALIVGGGLFASGVIYASCGEAIVIGGLIIPIAKYLPNVIKILKGSLYFFGSMASLSGAAVVSRRVTERNNEVVTSSMQATIDNQNTVLSERDSIITTLSLNLTTSTEELEAIRRREAAIIEQVNSLTTSRQILIAENTGQAQQVAILTGSIGFFGGRQSANDSDVGRTTLRRRVAL